MRILFFTLAILFVSTLSLPAQIDRGSLLTIVRMEDSRTYDSRLERMISSGPRAVRTRAILAAGRIGDDRAVPLLNSIVVGPDTDLGAHAAFALGEIESIRATEPIISAIRNRNAGANLSMRAVEAAGKIAAANPNATERTALGMAILDYLEVQAGSKNGHREGILAGLTAVIRSRPKDGDFVVGKFLTSLDPRIRTDAGNTLSRIGNKGFVDTLEAMVMSDRDPTARANAARALGVAESRRSASMLLQSALGDVDSRVRVSAIRSLGNLKDVDVVPGLIGRGEELLNDFKKSSSAAPSEKNELLEIVSTLGLLLQQTENVKAVTFIESFRVADKVSSPETEIAMARIAPLAYAKSLENAPVESFDGEWLALSAIFQGIGTLARTPDTDSSVEAKKRARVILARFLGEWAIRSPEAKARGNAKLAVIQLIGAFAAFKSENLPEMYQAMILEERDPGIRGALATALADTPATERTIRSLKEAFRLSMETDIDSNGAILATMNAVAKLDKQGSTEMLQVALTSSDSLVRRRAVELYKELQLSMRDGTNVAMLSQLGNVKGFDKTRLGQVFLEQKEYSTAIARKNGKLRAVVKTDKGTFTINLLPEDAPLTVDNFVRLANSGFYNGFVVHRVVPNFVIQDGDPRGDGMGGPGTNIRCEINTVPYGRGAVGMALSGKDTGGSQWFVTHSPQPHLDGGYTVFGQVPESDMRVVDSIARGDRIISINIVGR
jgi:cyclophilin family peptidyl-prolyl cis-trans isomerase/HEAT repeat protein